MISLRDEHALDLHREGPSGCRPATGNGEVEASHFTRSVPSAGSLADVQDKHARDSDCGGCSRRLHPFTSAPDEGYARGGSGLSLPIGR